MEIAGFQRDISNMMMSLEVGALSSDDLDALKTAEGKRGTYTIKLIEMLSLSVFELRNGAQHSPLSFQKSPYREYPAATQMWFSKIV